MDYERPLTTLMIRQLLNVRRIELLDNREEVPVLYHFKRTFAGLRRRGYVDIKKVIVNGKEMTGVFITANGISFVKHILENFKLESHRGDGTDEQDNIR